MPPTAAQVVIGTATVAVALVIAAYATRAVLRGHRLWAVCATGCVLVVVGVVGQRTFPSADAVSKLGRDEAARQFPGAWDAGVSIPVVGLHVTPVALVGLLLNQEKLAFTAWFGVLPDVTPELLKAVYATF